MIYSSRNAVESYRHGRDMLIRENISALEANRKLFPVPVQTIHTSAVSVTPSYTAPLPAGQVWSRRCTRRPAVRIPTGCSGGGGRSLRHPPVQRRAAVRSPDQQIKMAAVRGQQCSGVAASSALMLLPSGPRGRFLHADVVNVLPRSGVVVSAVQCCRWNC